MKTPCFTQCALYEGDEASDGITRSSLRLARQPDPGEGATWTHLEQSPHTRTASFCDGVRGYRVVNRDMSK